jgi:hypothetical protein
MTTRAAHYKCFVLQHPTACSPFRLISRQKDSEIAIADIKSSKNAMGNEVPNTGWPHWRGQSPLRTTPP